MSTQRKPTYTPEEYLDLERAAAYKSEFVNGEIFAMAGASPQHVLIVSNLVRELGVALKEGPCLVFSTDLKVRVRSEGPYFYPDVVVVCEEPRFVGPYGDTLENPQLLIEVLSPTTQDYDRGGKFEQYRTISSFVEYLLVAQDRIHIEHHVREADGAWRMTETNDVNGQVTLQLVPVTLLVREIYARIMVEGKTND
ncbi:MAG TPA: Uma2 family endonuclease [Acidobacteriota bacterium]|nr:Uma2 family endonuclease [Acidobacteriota bacterium]